MSEEREEYKVTPENFLSNELPEPRRRVEGPMPPSRELDALAARVMGYNVLGLAVCILNPECGGFLVSLDGRGPSINSGRGTTSQPVYLDHCICDIREPDAVEIWGHTVGCLEVVKEYSTEPTAAMEAWEWLARERHRPRMFTWDDMSTTVGIGVVKDDRLHQIETNGIDYKHAIALAVCEAGRHLGLI